MAILKHGDRTKSTAQVHRARSVVRRPGKLVLQIFDGPSRGTHELTRSVLEVGRSSLADLVVDHHSVSKLHFTLELAGDTGVLLTDLDSTNGTWFRDRRVRSLYIQAGDEFLAGDCRIRLQSIDDVEVETLEGEHFGLLRGSSLPMRELYAQIEALAPTPLDLLILGETGTGKELIAKTVHECSRRRGPFIILDCAALSTTLADGTLFGFRKGAFTGADHDQAGAFEEADGGTLFLDEVGELPLELQRKLLGVLERRCVTRLGEPARPREIDVRVLAATHRDLRREVTDGRFREDLYYRLSRAELLSPPLRERGDDPIALAELFLNRISREFGLRVDLSPSAFEALRGHRWPGNVRELRNVIERAAHVRRQGLLRAEDLRLGRGPSRAMSGVDVDQSYADMHTALDRVALPQLLERYAHNLSHMAAHLEVSRDTLRKRLKAVGLYPTT